MDQLVTPDTGAGMPVSALSADSKVNSVILIKFPWSHKYLCRRIFVVTKIVLDEICMVKTILGMGLTI